MNGRSTFLSWLLIGVLFYSPLHGAQFSDQTVKALRESSAAGKLDARFVATFETAVIEEIRSTSYAPILTTNFLQWIALNPVLRGEVFLAVAQCGPKVVSNLQILRTNNENAVLVHPSLALAFAAAWSAGKKETPRRYWIDDWMEHGRAVPNMVQSFNWYVQREGYMRVPLRQTPWPILAHMADALTPVLERDWVLGKYGRRKTADLRGLFASVPYKLDPKRKEPCTLASFLRIGGPCTHNVQFADGVFESFGIPLGWAGGPGHTFPYWFEQRTNRFVEMHINDLGTHDGTIRNPFGTGQVMEEDLRMLTDACALSESKRVLAAEAAWVFKQIPQEERTNATAILISAVHENPFCTEASYALAHATARRQLSPETAGAAWRYLTNALSKHPEGLISMLSIALPPKAKANAAPPEQTIDHEDELLNALYQSCAEHKRSDLFAKVERLRDRCRNAR
ncbi:MAG: hypothetical protein ACXWDN_16985 [Limisphaerales bacterium]